MHVFSILCSLLHEEGVKAAPLHHIYKRVHAFYLIPELVI